MYRNVVSGARISSGGLHLGHFLGCIQPLITSKEKIENYIFVLNSCDKILNKYIGRNAFRFICNKKQIWIIKLSCDY